MKLSMATLIWLVFEIQKNTDIEKIKTDAKLLGIDLSNFTNEEISKFDIDDLYKCAHVNI